RGSVSLLEHHHRRRDARVVRDRDVPLGRAERRDERERLSEEIDPRFSRFGAPHVNLVPSDARRSAARLGERLLGGETARQEQGAIAELIALFGRADQPVVKTIAVPLECLSHSIDGADVHADPDDHHTAAYFIAASIALTAPASPRNTA